MGNFAGSNAIALTPNHTGNVGLKTNRAPCGARLHFLKLRTA